MSTLNELGLSEELLKGILEMGFEKPMPIQEQAVPYLIENDRDLIGLAATGTGKTAAFGLPLLQKLDPKERSVQALILCPTRELCRQITHELNQFSRFLQKISVVAVYGGAPIGQQISALRRGAQVIVATPGRIKDLQNRGAADLASIKMLVLDEADEMLNMGFEEDLREILSLTPEDKQTALFSATLSPRIARIAAGYLRDPHEISVGKKNEASVTVDHSCYLVHPSDRYHALRRILDFNPGFYGIVFCRTRHNTSTLAASLAADGYGADALHGDIAQGQRDTIMRRFRSGASKILIATDVAARGIDVDNLTHVVHYELPDDSASYIHRSGRTGRANREGASIAIITPSERRKIPMLERLVKKAIRMDKLPEVQQICMKRLSGLVEQINESDDNISELESMVPEYLAAFDGLNREQLIRAFVAGEFAGVLEHYKNAPPLKEVNTHGRHSRRDAAHSGGRHGHRDRDRFSRNQQGRNFRQGGAGAGKPSRSERRHHSGRNGQFTRYFVSMGRKDGIQPKDIIGFVNQSTGNRNIPIGSIELKGSFSFFEADSGFQKEILSKSNGAEFLRRTIKVEKVNN